MGNICGWLELNWKIKLNILMGKLIKLELKLKLKLKKNRSYYPKIG